MFTRAFPNARRSRARFTIAVGVIACAVACGSQPQREAAPPASQTPPASQASSSATMRYDMKGKVVAIDKAGERLTIDHEAIPGFMGAMTMAYPVRDPHAFDVVSSGAEITAKVVSSGGSYWLEDVQLAKRTPPTIPGK
jgi:Cu/Ag efflux protein CusF